MNKSDKALLEKYALKLDLSSALIRIDTLDAEIEHNKTSILILFGLLVVMCVIILLVKFFNNLIRTLWLPSLISMISKVT